MLFSQQSRNVSNSDTCVINEEQRSEQSLSIDINSRSTLSLGDGRRSDLNVPSPSSLGREDPTSCLNQTENNYTQSSPQQLQENQQQQLDKLNKTPSTKDYLRMMPPLVPI